MCGIAGSIDFADHAKALDIGLLSHRGPDSHGEWRSSDGKIWLGHTRLAILDLSPSGHQPMVDSASGYVIVFNGEIYNHLDLRAELERSGAQFFGSSDTETLLRGYQCWGEAILPKLKGMFAFVIFNPRDCSVFLARDRFGIKPLYFRKTPSGLAFSSEVRPLVADSHCQPTRESITAFLQWGCCPHGRLLYPDVTEMPVGSHLRLTGGKIGEPVRYWPPPRFVTKARIHNRASIVEETRALIERSVKEHILSDVPVSCFLSGGIDSSIITALAARELKNNLHTFSVGFEDAAYDESKFSRMVAARYKTDHQEIKLSAEEVIENTKEAVMNMDLPSIDAINTYIVAKQVAKKGYKVALAGLGADEIFGGYPHFRQLTRLKKLAHLPQFASDLLLTFGKGRHIFTDIPRTADAGIFAQWWRRSWNSVLLKQAGLQSLPIETDGRPELRDDFAKISWSELSHYMRDMLLRDSDQMSMAVSLEIRVPFLDHELIEFALSLPAAEKDKPGFVKSLLIEATSDLLPPEIYQRRKMGFELPIPLWIKGPLKEFTLAGLDHAAEHKVLNERHGQSLYESFDAGNLHWTKLWGAVVLGWYLARRTPTEKHYPPGHIATV